ncbi:MAG: hypothetical protein P8Y58_12440 [Novosphingobium sp.]
MVRRPGDAIRSIVNLFARLGRDEYGTQEEAAVYYIERLAALEGLGRRFPERRRTGLTHEALLRDPDGALAAISQVLNVDPPLANHYVSLAASRVGGGGDPLQSGRYSRIEPGLSGAALGDAALDLPNAIVEEACERYRRLRILFGEE